MSTIVNESLLSLLGLSALVIGVAGYLWLALALSAMFRKMGDAPWKGWIPFLNVGTVLAWGGFHPWLVVLVLIPVLGPIAVLILLIVSAHRINPGFGYGTGMTVLAAFFFVVWASILGFGPARWLGARSPAWRPATVDPLDLAPVAPLSVAAAPVAASDAADSPDVFAPPSPPTAPVWVPPALTDPAPEAPATPPIPPAAPAEPERRAAAPAPAGVAWPAAVPAEVSWPAEIDDVSAVATSPFPPSAAAGSRHAAPPARIDPDDEHDADERDPGEEAGGPIAFVPGRRSAVEPPPAEPPVTRVPAAAPTRRRSARTDDDDDDPDFFPEMSGEVSAVVGAPSAGAPRSALSSVSAQQRRHEPFGADDDDDLERTVIARRAKKPTWELVPASGVALALTSDVVILGRRPAVAPDFPHAQLLSVADSARTVSKTHARIELRGERWLITDLASTNGVLLRTLMGEELEIEPGTELQAGERFYLGDEEFLLRRIEG